MPTRLNSTQLERPSCWREIITWCPQTSTSIRRRLGIATHCCSRRAAPRIGAFSRRVRPTHPRAPSQRTHVHVLGLHAEPLGARWRSASRPHFAEFHVDGAPTRRRRRSSNTRNGGRERPRAPLGQPSGGARKR